MAITSDTLIGVIYYADSDPPRAVFARCYADEGEDVTSDAFRDEALKRHPGNGRPRVFEVMTVAEANALPQGFEFPQPGQNDCGQYPAADGDGG